MSHYSIDIGTSHAALTAFLVGEGEDPTRSTVGEKPERSERSGMLGCERAVTRRLKRYDT